MAFASSGVAEGRHTSSLSVVVLLQNESSRYERALTIPLEVTPAT